MLSPVRVSPVLLLLCLAAACGGDPSFELDTQSIDFGATELGAPAKRLLVDLTNTGGDELSVTRVDLATGSTELSLDPPKETLVPPGMTTTFRVLYQPLDEGEDQGAVTIGIGDDPHARVLPVLGRGVTLALEYDATPIDFGDVDAAAPKTVSLSVLSNGTGAIDLFPAIESESREWTLDPSSFTGRLEPGERAEIKVTYAPTDASRDQGSLSIDTSSALLDTLRIPLSGAGVIAALCADPAHVIFRDVGAGASASARVHLTSCGNRPVTIDALELDSARSADELSVGGAPMLPMMLQPSQAIDFDVDFASTSSDEREGFVHVASDATLTPELFLPISANQPPPCKLEISPRAIRFFAAEHSEKRVTIANVGAEACSIDRLAIGTGIGTFSIVQGKRTPVSIPANDVTTLVLGYTAGPSSAWPESGTLEMEMSHGRSETIVLPLAGNPTLTPGCHLEPSPAALDFGRISVTTFSDQPVTLMNVGDAACTVSAATLAPGSSAAFAPMNITSTLIEPKHSATFSATYHPFVEGNAHGALLFTSSEVEAHELGVALYGFAGPVPPPPPEAYCPEGQQITYRRYDTRSVPSGVFDPAEVEPFHQRCEDHGCMGDAVAVEIDVDKFVCDDPPPACSTGLGLEYHQVWQCVPCDVVVQFGGLFDGLRVCAQKPQLGCGYGQSPTYDADMHRWQCKNTCDNGLYDRQTLEGDIVCVPC